MTNLKIFSFLFSSLFFVMAPEAVADRFSDLFPVEKSCVAYSTEKTFFLVRTVTVVGKSCDMSASVIPEPENKFHVEMSVPIAGLDSGEVERDRDVARLLKADVSKTLNFVSESVSFGVWQEKLAEGRFALNGKLYIGKKPYPITIEVEQHSGEGGEVYFNGLTKARFQALGIEPPSLFGGIGAKVSSKLELLFHLPARDVLGAQSLLNP